MQKLCKTGTIFNFLRMDLLDGNSKNTNDNFETARTASVNIAKATHLSQLCIVLFNLRARARSFQRVVAATLSDQSLFRHLCIACIDSVDRQIDHRQ